MSERVPLVLDPNHREVLLDIQPDAGKHRLIALITLPESVAENVVDATDEEVAEHMTILAPRDARLLAAALLRAADDLEGEERR